MKKTQEAPNHNPQKLTPYLLYKDVGKALDWYRKGDS